MNWPGFQLKSISHDGKLDTLVEFSVDTDSGTARRTSGNHGTKVCKG